MRLDRYDTLMAAALLAVATFGCSQVTVRRDGRPCDADGACIVGYECNSLTNICETAGSRCVDADVDDLCDTVDSCIDGDGDGYGNGHLGNGGCTVSTVDCDDADSGATLEVTYYPDTDGDTHGDSLAAGTAYCHPPAGVVTSHDDCNDGSATVHPGASEVCDASNTDEDCNGQADDQDVGTSGQSTFYTDGDGDGYGTPSSSTQRCDAAAGWVVNSDDCDDGAMAINPGAAEVCDASNTDEDCNGAADDADAAAGGKVTYYADSDGDGLGSSILSGIAYCDAPGGVVTNNSDCDDNNNHCTSNCNDTDGDAWCTGVDCSDSNATCNADCGVCVPSYLSLTGTSPTAVCSTANLSIDIDARIAAVGELSCTAPAEFLNQAQFSNSVADTSWTTVASVVARAWLNSFPAGCPTSNTNYFRRFDRNLVGYMRLASSLNVTGYQNIVVSFLVGYRDSPPATQELKLNYCCGAACSPTTLVATVDNANGGGTDACRVVSYTLPASANDCSALKVSFDFPSGVGYAAVDDVDVRGTPIFGTITEAGSGVYTTTLRSCVTAALDASCTWDDGTNPPRSGSRMISFQ
ncbi:MAG: putative metal-binding motif-containing protein [Myxococcota bacterium]